MFGKNKALSSLQKELKKTGADMAVVNDWAKIYGKVRKNYPKIQNDYEAEREKLKHLQKILKHMEGCFIAGGDVKNTLRSDVEQLKGMKEMPVHELLIDKGNTEFELTFTRLKKLMASLKKYSADDMLFLHSETENLADMVKEALERERPDLRAFTYFTLTQNESQLAELPYAEKMKKITRIYEREFIKPMEKILSKAVEKANEAMPVLSGNKDKTREERINYILEEWIWN